MIEDSRAPEEPDRDATPESPRNDPAPPESTRYWPDGPEPPAVDRRIEMRCATCGLDWWIDDSMAGFRLRCDCGVWLEIPQIARPESAEPALLGKLLPDTGTEGAEPVAALMPIDGTRADPLTEIPVGFEEAIQDEKIASRTQVPTNLSMPPGSLRHAPHETRTRWKNRTILELAAVMAAFWIPMGILHLTTYGEEQLLYMPFANLVSGLLVLGIGMTASAYTFAGLRMAPLKYWVEASAVAGAAAGLAILYMQWATYNLDMEGMEDWVAVIREGLGLPIAVTLVGVSPAIFEELAFRGLLQGRLSALFGRRLGITMTAVAFALAHGVTAGFPFHVFLGFYLCWLRIRSKSLYPGMLLHFAYNTTLVVAS